MLTTKCRCVLCNQCVQKWIDDKCIDCYHSLIADPLKKENQRLQEVWRESNQIWFSIVESYRRRRLVRLADWITHRLRLCLIMILSIISSVKNTLPSKKLN